MTIKSKFDAPIASADVADDAIAPTPEREVTAVFASAASAGVAAPAAIVGVAGDDEPVV